MFTFLSQNKNKNKKCLNKEKIFVEIYSCSQIIIIRKVFYRDFFIFEGKIEIYIDLKPERIEEL